MGSYEDGVTYLEGQLARCQHKLEEKDRALITAHKEVAAVRAEVAQEAAGMFDKMVALKAEHNEKVNKLESKITELSEGIRQKQREIKRLQRDNIVKDNEYGIEVNKLKFEIEELRKDYKRVIESKKETEADCRAEKDKALGSNNDILGVRRQKWLQLEKQKADLETIFREKEEQARLKYEGELQHKGSELAQLKHRQHLAEKDNDLLQQENKKLREEL